MAASKVIARGLACRHATPGELPSILAANPPSSSKLNYPGTPRLESDHPAEKLQTPVLGDIFSERMASSWQAGSSPESPQLSSLPHCEFTSTMEYSTASPDIDMFQWYPNFQNCQRYFLDVAQHTHPVQVLAAMINIQLPYQKWEFLVASGNTPPTPRGGSGARNQQRPSPVTSNNTASRPQAVSLIPYIRRLVVTGHDVPRTLHEFFGDEWLVGVGPLHEIERRNYLFAAKSADWMHVKQGYDMSPQEMVPFLRPLRNVTLAEIRAAEAAWSEWLAMQDWMLGPRRPETIRSLRAKSEVQD